MKGQELEVKLVEFAEKEVGCKLIKFPLNCCIFLLLSAVNGYVNVL
jgi:hypothetical protein